MCGMSLFQWKEDYLVGQPEIDTQHKKLFQLADQLHAAMTAGKGKDVLTKTLGDLVDYTKRHFAAEEKLMQKANYPEYLQHKAYHDKLTAQVVQFQTEFAAGKSVVTIQLLQFLKDWLQHHIGETDRKIAAFLSQQAA
jgi:hemerythrin